MYRIAFVTLALAASAVAHAGFSQEPVDFADVPIEDFQGLTTVWSGSYTKADPLVVGDVSYWGDVWASNGWCIPGMDSAPPCGGDNIYLASALNVHIVPPVGTSALGFQVGSQGPVVEVFVTLVDGSTDHLTVVGTEPNGWGGTVVVDFVGYVSDGAAIEEIYVTGRDGGIDNVQLGFASGSCDDLVGVIEAFELETGIENSLLAKLRAAERSIARGKPDVAVNQLQALLAELNAQRDNQIDAGAADQLSDCIDGWISELL
jgi:hypothetical protein